MRPPEQMRSVLAEYPAVGAALDGLSEEHGELLVSTVEDFCDRHPDSEALRRAAIRISGTSVGWFLVASGGRIWTVAGGGQAAEITDALDATATGGGERGA